ncbi:MAG: serine/threonine-protein kinase [Gammaproteobacteria bacterium]|nr:serine/threonine-protein kinase [Gammaproteobacteria bacterium]
MPSEAAQAGLCAVLALFFALGGDRLVGIERGFYDLCQRLSAAAADAPVVIVQPDADAADLWSLPRLDELIASVRAAGAKAIIPATPAPPLATTDDVSRLQTLLRIEERGGDLAGSAEPGLLRRQLAEAQERLARQESIATAIRTAGNVVLGLATTEYRPGLSPASSPCSQRVAAASALVDAPGSARPAAAALVPAATALCEAAAAIGHVALLTDRDGVVRRTAPVLTTEPGAVPSSALAAIRLEGDEPRQNGNLARFYSSAPGTMGFTVIAAGDILAGRNADALRDRYVVIGSAEAGPAHSVRTPLDDQSGAAALIATDLANYLMGDQISRPGWALWLEIGLALLLAVGAVLSGRLSLPVAAVIAVTGMLVLLLAEYVLVAMAGVWFHLAGLALFCLTGVALLQSALQLSRQSRAASTGGAATPGSSAAGPAEELDLGFSVLRQQPTTERTKAQLYELAMEHGRKRDYARAERVFRHLAARDPGYRDVAAKLEKLSGARGVAPQKAAPRSSAPAPGPGPGPAPDPEPAAVSSAGRTLGRYELERVIGRGAMATVYLGRDPTINRRVAIKTLPLAEEFADNDLATARSHFLREAESAGRLNHPYIISIHDAGEDNNVAYLAMEYFEGKPLSHYAQLGRLLPPKVVFELIARAAEALHYAHSQNVVHRDVKPANLMYDITSDRLKLTDFGIARLTDSSRTRTGIILGTPSYMSPEQLSASKVSGQTDLYSLGVTMYHLLTGAPPFQADSIPRLMDKIVHQKHRPVSDIRDDVPACADTILDRALAKNPADRYESGKAMALALRECCSTFPSDIV